MRHAHLLFVVAGIAIVDSLNPSTIGPALVLAAGSSRDVSRRHVRRFVAGVFSVQLLGGLVLVLGPGQLLLAAVPRPGREARHIAELVIGSVLMVAAGVLVATRRRLARRGLPSPEGGRGALALGAAIAAAELPTALPYFAAIAAIVDSDAGVPSQLFLLVVFNVLFVAPLVAIVIVMRVAGDRAEASLARMRARFERDWPALTAALFLAAGALLVAVGLAGIVR